MQKENPFNIVFGKEPFALISRRNELEEIYDSFSNENPYSDVFILTGVRGSGKTVAMSTIFEDFKKRNEWICVELNPEVDMLEQLASRLYDEGKLKKIFLNKEFSFSFKGIGISISENEKLTNVSSFLKKELEYISKKGKRVLVTIDEVTSNANVKIFVHEYQSFLRAGFPVCLLMTGLYQNISMLENQKSLTFLYRAPKIYLGELNIRAISNSYKNIFDISEKESVELAKLTNGYAYAYQLLGNILFESGKRKVDSFVLDSFDEQLHERSYNMIYNELTPKEKEILKCANIDNSNKYIMENIRISKSQLSNIKKVLFLKGIIKENREGIVYRLPRFKEFISFMCELEE